jgi:succinate dehydrogenase/fumarate reductase flavoprotein subunit
VNKPPIAESWDKEVDVLVVGSGAAGMTASLVAATEGLQTLLCEKTSLIGDKSAVSGGTL